MLFAKAVLVSLWCEVGSNVRKECFFKCFSDGR